MTLAKHVSARISTVSEKLNLPKRTFEVTVEGDGAGPMVDMMQWVSKQARAGTGISITAKDNGGQTMDTYIDGDGPDQMEVKEK